LIDVRTSKASGDLCRKADIATQDGLGDGKAEASDMEAVLKLY
jgi:hypothetical protein